MNAKTAGDIKSHLKLICAYRGIRYSKNLYRKIKKLYEQTPQHLRPQFWELLDKHYGHSN